MNQSKNSGKVSNALAKVQAEMGTFTVNKEGYNFAYLTLAKILEIVLPIAGKHNMSIMQFPTIDIVADAPWVTILTRINCDEEWIEDKISFPMILPTKKTDTEIMCMGASISYMRRFALQSILGIAGNDKEIEDIQMDEIEDLSNN